MSTTLLPRILPARLRTLGEQGAKRSLGMLLRGLPDRVHSELLSRLFNHLLKGQYLAEQLGELEGKRLAIGIRDCRSQLLFVIKQNRLQALPGKEEWDVRISGDLAEFWLLASRREDPDTLFFNRRLSIEGETEAGLHIKNLLDGMDFDLDAHLEAVAGKTLARRLAPMLRRLPAPGVTSPAC